MVRSGSRGPGGRGDPSRPAQATGQRGQSSRYDPHSVSQSQAGARRDPTDWDARRWIDSVRRDPSRPNQKIMREQVAKHNYQVCQYYKETRCKGYKWFAPQPTVSSLCCGIDDQAVAKWGLKTLPRITFAKQTTADAAFMLMASATKQNQPSLVAMNFANGSDVGGGYLTGAKAQEEDLCRQFPSLYSSLLKAKRDGLYPFGPPSSLDPATGEVQDRRKYTEVLFTEDLVMYRLGEDDGYAILPADKRICLSFVAAAAPNWKQNEKFVEEAVLSTLHHTFIFPQQALASDPNRPGKRYDVMICGAWGCGAFGNDPYDMACIFAKAVKTHGCLYKRVHFAIPASARDESNYESFRKAFVEQFHGTGVTIEEVEQDRTTTR